MVKKTQKKDKKASKNTDDGRQYASFNMRMLASIIDSLLSMVLIVPVVNVFYRFLGVMKQQNLSYSDIEVMSVVEQVELLKQMMLSSSIQLVVVTIAVLVCWIYLSATPGKIMLKMKIIDATSGKKPSNMQWVIRYLGYVVSLLPLCIGFVWIHFDKRKQAFHDKMANTVVVRLE